MRKWNSLESRVLGEVIKVAKVLINPINKIGPIESPFISNIQ